MGCDEKIQTELPKTVGQTNSYRNTEKSYEANTMQFDRLHFLKEKSDIFVCC